MKNLSETAETRTIPWKLYLVTTLETIAAFYIATFCMALFFLHHGSNWLVQGLILLALYIFVLFACIKIIIRKLTIAAIMLVIPIAPLLALFTVISFIPLIEKFQ